MYLTMNYDLAQSILIITKIKVMKFPVSRRLKTWNDKIFTELCPFGCGVEDNEEHAFLKCKICILKNAKYYITIDSKRKNFGKNVSALYGTVKFAKK